jgi:inhibitor of cysteine peptidase
LTGNRGWERAVLRRRWWVAVLAVALAGLAGLVLAGLMLDAAVQRSRYGDLHSAGAAGVEVDRGSRFSLAVPDRGASVGDHWTVAVAPEGIAALTRSELVGGSILDRLFGPATGGGGGTRYFVFVARHPGATTITLRNCFQGCDSDRTRGASREAVWTVTVR